MIDWDAIHASLAAAERATNEALEPSADRDEALLARRAAELAREPASTVAATTTEWVVFTLANERYALGGDQILQVTRLGRLTRVPSVPSVFVGVTSFGGEVLAVVDLRQLFGLVSAPPTDRSRLLVLGADHPELGVVADSVVGVEAFDLGSLAAARPSDERRRFVRGIGPEALVILDGNALRTDPTLFVNQPAHLDLPRTPTTP